MADIEGFKPYKTSTRYLIKRCGECKKSGKYTEFSSNWARHFKEMHIGIEPYGTILGTDQNENEVEVDQNKY